MNKMRFVYGSLASLCALFFYNGTAHASVVDSHLNCTSATHSLTTDVDPPVGPIGGGGADGTTYP